MKKAKLIILTAVVSLTVLHACKKEPIFKGEQDPELIKNYSNSSASTAKMDSIASLNFITKQKLTEIYELTSLYNSKKNDSLMKDILFPQIQSYFMEIDSLGPQFLLSEMDSLNVHFIEIRDLELMKKDTISPDSIKMVRYNVNYFSDDKKFIKSERKTAEYVLKKEPKKFKHEFVFYFMNLDFPFEEPVDSLTQEVNDTIPSGDTQ